MKKTILVAILIVLISIIVIGCIVFKNKKTNNEEDYLGLVQSYIDKINFPTKGTIDVAASYKGAHGEKYPANYSFNYELETNDNYKLIIGNDTMYKEYSFDNEIFDLINELKKFDFSKIDINTKEIDGITIEKNSKELTFTKGNNVAKLNINDLGYSFYINDNFKMNAIFSDNEVRYNVVINSVALFITDANGEIELSTSSESSIYNGMDIVIKEDNNINTLKTTEVEEDEIPLIRYFKNINLDVWK